MTTTGIRTVVYAVRWLVLLAMLPVLVTTPEESGKGLAGKPTAAQMAEMGATWWHTWRPCRAGEIGCVDHVKARWTLDEGSSFYGDLANMRERLALCESGWFMFGDEYRIQGWPLDDQLDELAWFVSERDAVNPDCRIAFGGVEPWHPNTGYNADWVSEFACAYRDRYGILPPIDAVMIDCYDWPSREPFDGALDFVMEIRRVYGQDCQIWAREIGCLMSTNCAIMAVDRLNQITPWLDRWAWFITSPDSNWADVALYDAGGRITDLGKAYAAWQERETVNTFLPVVVK